MEKFNYYFNTKSRIDAALSEPVTKANMNSILFNLIWHAYYNISTDESVIVDYVVNWMSEKTKIFHLSAYAKTIKLYIKKIKKMPWRNIRDTVKVRKSELDYIASFNDIKKEKILFCYLAIAKFKDMSREHPTHWEDEDDVTVFKMAKVPIPASERDYFINELIEHEPYAKITHGYKNDETSKRIDYISDDENDPVVLELDESSYHELAFTYLNWKNGGGYKKCKCCGRLFRVKHNAMGKDDKLKKGEQNPESQYCRNCKPMYEKLYKGKDEMALDYEAKKIVCRDCGKEFYPDSYMATDTCRCNECRKKVAYYTPMRYKTITCVDCGKEVLVSSMNTRACRCEDCQSRIAYYERMEYNTIICIDCGKKVVVSSMDNNTCRCEDCNLIYQRKRNAEKNKAYRERKKSQS